MLDTARKIFALLSRRERIQLGLLFGAMVVVAFLEMASVAAVLPFLSVAADPTRIETNELLRWAYETLGFAGPTQFLIGLGVLALAALIISNLFMAVTSWAQHRFARMRTHSLSERVLRHYLAQPYPFFVARNSADLSKNVLTEVEQVTREVIVPALQMSSKAIVALAIIALLIAFDPLLAVVVTFILGGAYAAIYAFVRRRLASVGRERVAANAGRYKYVSEAFGGIKETKLLGKEEAFIKLFSRPSKDAARARAAVQLIGEMPRYALDAVAFGGILLIAIYLIVVRDDLQQVIPVLGLYAFAGYRLMPSLQQVFSGLAKVRFGGAAVENLHRELKQGAEASITARVTGRNGARHEPALSFTSRVDIDDVTFTYPGAARATLRHVSLTIRANTTVGLVGPTGSGKTTLADIILGLLRPQEGEIRVDGVPLTDGNLRAWQQQLGYVPQHIYLYDDSVARNIAFGVPPSQIDPAQLERAARIANIHDFIIDELPHGYDTVVGERGVRLSGGQRQRIGIARALYHDPALLVLDEATNALDRATETAVMEAVVKLSGRKTLIIIAHREATLREADVVYSVGRGSIAEAFRPDQMLAHPSG
jgi:ATP-binding cassette, subfamily B, bacterial PglK